MSTTPTKHIGQNSADAYVRPEVFELLHALILPCDLCLDAENVVTLEAHDPAHL